MPSEFDLGCRQETVPFPKQVKDICVGRRATASKEMLSYTAREPDAAINRRLHEYKAHDAYEPRNLVRQNSGATFGLVAAGVMLAFKVLVSEHDRTRDTGRAPPTAYFGVRTVSSSRRVLLPKLCSRRGTVIFWPRLLLRPANKKRGARLRAPQSVGCACSSVHERSQGRSRNDSYVSEEDALERGSVIDSSRLRLLLLFCYS